MSQGPLGPMTAADKCACADREVGMRAYVYPRRVADGKLTQAKADRELALMRAIADDYRRLAEADKSGGSLL